jgi:cell wall assembly regulator SMI1
MDRVWGRIEAWLAANAPAVAASLNPPAPADELAEAERFLGVQLPDAVRRSYLRHDGQAPRAMGMLDCWKWLPLAEVRRTWAGCKDLRDRGVFGEWCSHTNGGVVVSDWWSPGWVPLTRSATGDNHCLDLAPGPQGKYGQVIQFIHNHGARPVVAAGFEEWLAAFADDLEAGKYAVSESLWGLCRREHL